MTHRLPASLAFLCLLAVWGPVWVTPAAPPGAAKPAATTRPTSRLPPGKWDLVFRDEFDGTTADLDKHWAFQNGPSGHILCSRWRENAVVADGVLRLLAKKQTRAGQHWTAASMWTRCTFQYGYFECRYRYAAATGTNNSFWMMTRDGAEAKAKGIRDIRQVPGRFEIDINEGHVPDEINTNIHNWTGKHWAKSKRVRQEGLDLSKAFHVYGLAWSEKELVWYFDGREIRREPNTICRKPAPVWLSLAIMKWAGPVTDAIDGTSMDVDYVRVYRLRK